MSTFDHGWYWTPRSGCWQETEIGEDILLLKALCLILEESAGQRLWRELRNFQQTPSNIRRRNQRVQTTVTTNYHMWLWRTPDCGGWPLNKINSFHNNIWFDSFFSVSSSEKSLLFSINPFRLISWYFSIIIKLSTSYTFSLALLTICWEESSSASSNIDSSSLISLCFTSVLLLFSEFSSLCSPYSAWFYFKINGGVPTKNLK